MIEGRFFLEKTYILSLKPLKGIKAIRRVKKCSEQGEQRLWDTEGSNAASQCPWVSHELRLQRDPASVLHVHMDSSKSSGFLPYTSQ